MVFRVGGVQATFDAVRSKIKERAAEGVEERLREMARFAVSVSPVDTGAYVTSFSIGPYGFGGGRARTSHGKQRGQNEQDMRQTGLDQMLEDIAGLKVKESLMNGGTKFTIRNRAPHARTVEDGSNWEHKDGYAVFTKLRNKFG